VKQNGIGIFTQVNWIAFYCIFVIIGSFVYMWRDLRAAFGVIGACCGAGVAEILKEVYIHGMYLGSDEDRRCSLLRAIPVSVAIWLLLTLTVPLRMLLYIIRDIVCLFRNDPMLDNYSYPGNIMGSIGILFILYGVTGIISSSGAEGYVIIAVGAVVCIIAHMLCKVREYA
ncbi:MAG: hypothetical protein IKB34_08395, partial [Clostridia bacterium]|nr:hypothetical protein [Clostridia bacterium]